MGTALLVLFVMALVAGVPIAVVMGGAGLVALVVEGKLSLLSVPQRFFNGINSFPLMAVPFFILAADLMTASGLTSTLLRFSNALVGHIRGGLGHVNVLTSMFFSGISGSALADAAGPGAVEMRLMHRAGYDFHYSGALSAATAVIGPIIPPSIIMVVYVLTDARVTVAGLFLAGIVPGILLGLVLFAANHYLCLRHGYGPAHAASSWRERGKAFVGSIPVLAMPVLILAGILSGAFTATEASAVAVIYALLVGSFVTRTLTPRVIVKVFLQSALVTSAALLIISMAALFGWLLTLLQLPQGVAAIIAGVSNDPLVILLVVAAAVLVCGMFIDTLAALILLVPVLSPLGDRVGIDPLHFAMVMVLTLAIGMITPPVGGVLFVTASVGRLRFERLTRAILPLLVAELVVVLLVVLFPPLSTAVPRWAGYTR